MIEATLREIVNYWQSREDECGLGVDWAEADHRCWRCGYKCRLHRCHIIPNALEGPADPSNLVLLCGRCHREAPNVDDPRMMWVWLRTTCVSFYNMYWTIRGVQEFEVMFGRKPLTGPEFEHVSSESATELLRSQMQRATIHFGEGRMNPATIACILALIEEKITGKLPERRPYSPNDRQLTESVLGKPLGQP